MKCVTTRVLAPAERLAAVRKEPFAKRRKQHAVCYIDRQGEWTMLGQKIQALSAAINQHVANESWARVSTTGLWGNCDVTDSRIGGWHKGRWRIKSIDLDSATSKFEAQRVVSKQSAVVGDVPSCYAIQSS